MTSDKNFLYNEKHVKVGVFCELMTRISSVSNAYKYFIIGNFFFKSLPDFSNLFVSFRSNSACILRLLFRNASSSDIPLLITSWQ